MAKLTRRTFLAAAGCAAAFAATPDGAALSAVPSPTPLLPVPKATTPAWAVGTAGEWDWRPVHADTELQARMEWVCEQIGEEECEEGGPFRSDCGCNYCYHLAGAEVQRVEAWDGKDIKIGSAEWWETGLGANCSRCGYESFPQENGELIDGEPVCHECMSVEDWEEADPERAADLREDEMRREIRRALAGEG